MSVIGRDRGLVLCPQSFGYGLREVFDSAVDDIPSFGQPSCGTDQGSQGRRMRLSGSLTGPDGPIPRSSAALLRSKSCSKR